jgi:hypothetical protein
LDKVSNIKLVQHLGYRLTQLIAEKVIGGHVSSISSIPVITHARASPFLA